MDKEKLKSKVNEAKEKAISAFKVGCNSLGKFYLDHEEEIRKAAPIVVPTLVVGTKAAIKAKKNERERSQKELYHYDRREDEWYMSRRPLTSSEKLRLRELYDLGYSKGEALKAMRLLK